MSQIEISLSVFHNSASRAAEVHSALRPVSQAAGRLVLKPDSEPELVLQVCSAF